MAFGNRPGALDELDLHSLVDGYIDEERRPTVVRMLATSPGDRARVEAWQGQNDLLRSTFGRIERETLLPMLDLSSRSRLQCIPANDAPLVAPAENASTKGARRVHLVAIGATLLVIAVGLGGSWLLLDSSRPEPATPVTTVALAKPATEDGIARLPTTQIPDLSAQGLRFSRAETRYDPATIVFRYSDAVDDVSVSVSRPSPSTSDETAPPVRRGDTYNWRRHGAAFSVAGTAKPERLREIATALQRTEPR